MSDVVLGGLISLVSSVATTVVVATLAYRRELRTRWDRDTLTTVSQSLVSVERAMGLMYAWAQGELDSRDGHSRPDSVAQLVDKAYYQLEELAVLFPKIGDLADGIQADLVRLANVTAAERSVHPVADSDDYVATRDQLRDHIRLGMDELRSMAQQRLAIA